jgi:NAD(P)-dependent dehydrogenase (short-subunit alcohol dehydrogenase family)
MHIDTEKVMPVALVTGASRGLGQALAQELSARGWNLVVDGRDPTALNDAAALWSGAGEVVTIPGDVGDAVHREALAAAVRRGGGLDLLVNNASALGPSPLPRLERFPVDELERLFRINSVAPLALIQLVLPELTAVAGAIVNVTSDAAVEAYAGWGGYGASKAALDQLSAVLAVEQPALRVYAFDPGDMRTAMHQLAFPGEDISDRPEPEAVAPALLRLIEERPVSGRYRASDLLAAVGSTR